MFTLPTALDPYRWALAAGALLVAALAVWGAYEWAYSRGYDAREREQLVAEADQKVKNGAFDAERVRDGTVQARRLENLIQANNERANREKTSLRLRAPVAAAPGGMCSPGSAGVSGLSAAGSGADACAGISAELLDAEGQLIDARRAATNNADQVTALQAFIEAARAGYNQVTGQTDKRPVSDAQARWAGRLKALEQRADTLTDKR